MADPTHRPVTAAYYPPHGTVEALSVVAPVNDPAAGVITVVWRTADSVWHGPAPVTRLDRCRIPSGAHVATAFYEPHNTLEALAVDSDGAVWLFWKTPDSVRWFDFQLTSPGFAPRGAPIAISYFPPQETLEALIADNNGVVWVFWKSRTEDWRKQDLTPRAFVRGGAPITCSYFEPQGTLEAFCVNDAGQINALAKTSTTNWGPFSVAKPYTAPSAAGVASASYAPHKELYVFFVDALGALRAVWKRSPEAWQVAPLILSFPGLAPAGAPIAAANYPLYGQLEVFVFAVNGALNIAWRDVGGNWRPPSAATVPEFAMAGESLGVAFHPATNRLDLFGAHRSNVLHVLSKKNKRYWEPCPVPLEPFPAVFPLPQVHVAGTALIGQLTGNLHEGGLPQRPRLRLYRPLLNDTTGYGVAGVDLGANAMDSVEGRRPKLWIFFGDVPHRKPERRNPNEPQEPYPAPGQPQADADLVASIKIPSFEIPSIEIPSTEIPWIETPPSSGHEAEGIMFRLPYDPTSVAGQHGWRYCIKCHALHREGEQGVCAGGGLHVANGERFVLPVEPSPVEGQAQWRKCGKCKGAFFAGNEPGVCPAGGWHAAEAGRLVIPLDTAAIDHGQREWRFCKGCHALFFDGYAHKGRCAGSGQAFRMDAVLGEPVLGRQFFKPFTVDEPIRELRIGDTPTGAFWYDGRMYVFVWLDRVVSPEIPQGSYLVSTDDPARGASYRKEFQFSRLYGSGVGFFQVAPQLVRNSEHPWLPATDAAEGVVLIGHGKHNSLNTDAIHVAWMPLRPNQPPVRNDVMYYRRGVPWVGHEHEGKASPVIVLRGHYTSVSAMWQPELKQWILLYSKANDIDTPMGSIVARIGPTPFEWQHEVEVFNPCRDGAWGNYMHSPGMPDLYGDFWSTFSPTVPGWAYGAFILQPFTWWDEATSALNLYYLLSLSQPYQVQVMFTRIRIEPLSPVWP